MILDSRWPLPWLDGTDCVTVGARIAGWDRFQLKSARDQRNVALALHIVIPALHVEARCEGPSGTEEQDHSLRPENGVPPRLWAAFSAGLKAIGTRCSPKPLPLGALACPSCPARVSGFD